MTGVLVRDKEDRREGRGEATWRTRQRLEGCGQDPGTPGAPEAGTGRKASSSPSALGLSAALLTPWFWACSLQSQEQTSFCGFKPPQDTDTPSKPAAVSLRSPALHPHSHPAHLFLTPSKSAALCLQTALESARISPSSVAALAPTQPVCLGSRPSLHPVCPAPLLGVPTCFTESFSPMSSFLYFIL